MVYTSPPDPRAFNARIWEIVRQIPRGKVMTYGQIAAMIPPPEDVTIEEYKAAGARWVGGRWRPARTTCPGSASSTPRAK